jgi:hypothetical protein
VASLSAFLRVSAVSCFKDFVFGAANAKEHGKPGLGSFASMASFAVEFCGFPER